MPAIFYPQEKRIEELQFMVRNLTCKDATDKELFDAANAIGLHAAADFILAKAMGIKL